MAGSSYLVAIRNAWVQAILDAWDSGSGAAVVKFYSGTEPTDIDAAKSGNTLLAEITLSDPSGTVSAGVLTIAGAPKTDLLANATGTCTFCRVENSAGVEQTQHTVATSGQPFTFNTASFVLNEPVELTSGTITAPNA